MDEVFAERLYPTPYSTSPLLPLLLLSLATQKHAPRIVNSFYSEYDYVVVGSGAGGSVVANRLSEIPCVNVLLLEAGKVPPRLTDIPAIGRSFLGTDIDWNFRTEPQKYTGAGLINRQVVIPSGKAIGGSTIHNGPNYVRGNRKDFDNWSDSGAAGWSYRDVLPYFKKMENVLDPRFVNEYRGTGGPVSVEIPAYNPELQQAIDEAVYQMGLKKVDSNGYMQTGFTIHQSNLRKSQRCSTAKAYLVPAENRTNLHILSNAFVKKVIIQGKRAVGVQFDYEDFQYEVKARREVILSAGAINSAQLLMLSGIGPKQDLEKLEIPVIADLPVGLNLQQHGAAMMMYTLSDSIAPFSEKLSDERNILKYIDERKGPLASPSGDAAIAFLASKRYNLPDFPHHELSFSETSAEIIKTTFGIRPEVYERIFGPYENSTLYVCISHQLHPSSRGYVSLRSANPYDHPLINPNYFHDPLDIVDVVEGMKACDVISNSEPLRKIGTKPFATVYPGCENVISDYDLYLECMVRTIPYSNSHQSGTAKMGHPSDPSTVVDPQLRVKGIKGLRVVDASIMPFVTSGNTMAPTIMIGEKASDMIKETIECYDCKNCI